MKEGVKLSHEDFIIGITNRSVRVYWFHNQVTKR
jgi:hypothetical protein